MRRSASRRWRPGSGIRKRARRGRCPPVGIEPTPLLGSHDGTAYFLLYNGILGDRRPQGGNVLTGPILALLDQLAPASGPRVVYGESCRLSPQRLKAAGIVFKQIPYDIRAR